MAIRGLGWLLGLALAGCAASPPTPLSVGSIAIDRMVMASAPEAGADVAAYAGFENRGVDDRLLEIECDCAQSVELHRVVSEGRQTRMRNDFPLALPSAVRTEVRPPGVPLHFMLIKTVRPFVVGERILMRLRFERAGNMDVVFTVVASTREGWDAWPGP
ncbi:MAG: copper chaperone PCu(A)C [Sphingomonadales bacterium]|nr:MAG: copper chaperone PCu(A)C [Sphingomonadales bacterium]